MIEVTGIRIEVQRLTNWRSVCSCWLMMWTHLGIGFGLAAAAAVTVFVGAGISVFVNSVQKPEEELEGIMLRVSPKL